MTSVLLSSPFVSRKETFLFPRTLKTLDYMLNTLNFVATDLCLLLGKQLVTTLKRIARSYYKRTRGPLAILKVYRSSKTESSIAIATSIS
jgi:hypothetical protein